MSTSTTTSGGFTTSLDDGAAASVERTARELVNVADGLLDDPAWVSAARAGWHHLPRQLRDAVSDFRRNSGPSGALLLRNLPVGAESLGDTPTVPGSVQRRAGVSAAVLMMVAHGLGDPVAFLAEKSGALVQDVVPVPGQEEVQGNSGSVLLSFHSENAFHEHRPDYVMLLCLRSDHEGVAGLRTACVREALPLLSADDREALSAEEFVTVPPPSFGDHARATPHAVLFGAPEDPDVRVDFAATRPTTQRAARALSALQEAFGRTSSTVRLRQGDLSIVDNRVTVHGRTAFTPRYDGRDRWLQRTFVLADLRRSRSHRPDDGHVLVR
jgi:L-asparagine oxygenase